MSVSSALVLPAAHASRAYLEDAEYDSSRTYIDPLVHDFPRKVLSETKAMPSTAEALSKWDGVAVNAYQMNSMIAQAQSLNPSMLVLRKFNPGGYQGWDSNDACNEAWGVPFGSTGSATQGCSFFAGHFIYYAGTTLTSSLSSSGTSMTVSDGKRIDSGSYVVIYDAPAGSFRNAEHARVRSVNGNTITFSQRGLKSTARAHSAGAIIAQHPAPGSTEGSVNQTRWMYNQSTACPTDSNGKQFSELAAAWIASNYNKDKSGKTFSGRVDGILLDTDAWSIAWRDRIDADNDLVPDGGWNQRQGVNYWGDGYERFYELLRNRLPNALLVGGDRDVRGFSDLSGVQMEGWPVSGAYYTASPEYEETDQLLSNYTLHLREGPQHLAPYTENLSRTPTRLYPDGTTPVPSNNAPFRFALGTTLLDDGYLALEPTSHMRDPWWDEFAVDVDSSSSSYGSAVRSNANNESQARDAGGWLGQPVGPRHRVYSDADYAPSASLIAGGSLDSASSLTDWRASNVNISLDTSQRMSGTGAMRVSKHSSYASSSYQATVNTPAVSLRAGVTYTLAFSAMAQQPRALRVSGADQKQNFLIPDYWVRRVYTFTPSRTQTARISFGVGEENVALWLDDVYLFEGDTNVFTREFENGMVVVNASESRQTVALGGSFLRIRGTGQDSMNSGATVTSVSVNPRDAILLVRPKGTSVGGGAGSGSSGGGSSGGGSSGGGTGTGSTSDVACGAPSLTAQSPRGLYVWQDCDSQNWHILASAGGSSSTVAFVGSVAVSSGYTNAKGVQVEQWDDVDFSNSRLMEFKLKVQKTGVDRIDFAMSDSADACLTLSAPSSGQVYVGQTAESSSGSFDPRTLEACEG